VAYPEQSIKTTLGRIARVDRVVVAPDRLGSGTPYIGLEHIDSDCGQLASTVVSSGELRSAKFAFSRQHVLYGKLRPYLHKVARPEFEGVCSTDILPILPNREVDRDYLFHFLRSPAVTGFATMRSVGVNLPRISPTTLLTLPIVLPPLTEQRRIAAMLDLTDRIRRGRRDCSRVTAELLASSYDALVGPKNEDYLDWPEHMIADLAERTPGSIRTGPFGSSLRHSEFVDEGVAVLGIDNAVQNRFAWAERRFVSAEKFERLRRYEVKPGDVIVTIMGTTGRSAVVPDDIPRAISTKHLAVITPDRSRVIPMFLSHTIHSSAGVSRQLSSANRGAIMAGLNVGVIRRLRVRLPPLAVQARFATAVQAIYMAMDRMDDASMQSDRLLSAVAGFAFRW
jgi:type I restriction enzyme S subunit